jgi:hypothetical protein
MTDWNNYEECKNKVTENGLNLQYVNHDRFTNDIYEEICKIAVHL